MTHWTDTAGYKSAMSAKFHVQRFSRFLDRTQEQRNWIDAAILLGWTAIVGFRIAEHVMWRDEVRALSIALGGDTFIEMLQRLHGEGHPAVWYVLLRAAYDVFGRVEVLPALAFVVSAAAAALLAFRAPFSRAMVLILLTGHLFLFEYSVTARNYGISALLLFAIAACYGAHRDRGIVLGILLFLLANTNVIAAILVGAFLVFWLLDLLQQTGLRWTPKLTSFAVNATIATAGVLVCGLTILPTYNDAAAQDWSSSSPLFAAVKAVVHPGSTSLGSLFPAHVPGVVRSLLLFALTLGLWARRPAFAAALAGLMLTSVFMAVAAAGGYRHAAIWLCFCVALYWISWQDVVGSLARAAPRSAGRVASTAGCIAFLLVLGLQSVIGLNSLRRDVATGRPFSRSADLARLVASRSDLANAIIVGEPDYLLEPLPYYLKNRTYLLHAHRFGTVVRFSRSGTLGTDLGEILREGEQLKQTTGSPVVVLMSHRLDEIRPGEIYRVGYNWTFSASAAQIKEFLDAATLIQRFEPAETDESFDVYLLK